MQHDDLAAGRKARSTDDLEAIEQELESAPAPQPPQPEKRYGVVAVCAGEGIASVFTDLGADRIIEGGQTMNPSTEDILQRRSMPTPGRESSSSCPTTRTSSSRPQAAGRVPCPKSTSSSFARKTVPAGHHRPV